LTSGHIPSYDFLDLAFDEISRTSQRLARMDNLFSSRKVPAGWIRTPLISKNNFNAWTELVTSVTDVGARSLYLIGMGGSILGASALIENPFTLPKVETFYLDSNHPDFIKNAISNTDFSESIFVVCSKSGHTVETLTLFRYIFNLCSKQIGLQEACKRFVSVTDLGSPLEKISSDMGIPVTYSASDIGGRFSVLSSLSIIPSLMSVSGLEEIIEGGEIAMKECIDSDRNREIQARVSFMLSRLRSHRDKLSICVPLSLQSFGAWLIQLIAESLGKDGKGFIPRLQCLNGGEKLSIYDDEFCVVFTEGIDSYSKSTDVAQKHKLIDSNLIEINISNANMLGQEFYYWEYSVALMGLMLKINPFDQPHVELSKNIFDKINSGNIFHSQCNQELDEDIFAEIGAQVIHGKYIAIILYLNPSEKIKLLFEKFRAKLENIFHVPVILDFGPRYLHSTGQLYKGGPNSGIFIQVLEHGLDQNLESQGLSELHQQMILQAYSDNQAMQQLGRFISVKTIPYGDLQHVENLLACTV
tara:strand:+ start:2598 stop:4184 length:1587 start_codon:yes stop_codon:yes gene_type:complete